MIFYDSTKIGPEKYIMMIRFTKYEKKFHSRLGRQTFQKKNPEKYDRHFHELHFDSTLCYLTA